MWVVVEGKKEEQEVMMLEKGGGGRRGRDGDVEGVGGWRRSLWWCWRRQAKEILEGKRNGEVNGKEKGGEEEYGIKEVVNEAQEVEEE